MKPSITIRNHSAFQAREKMLDWTLLPQELLHLISEKLGDSFDAVIQARSVCNPWRSAFPYPSRLLSWKTYSLPSFEIFPRKTTDFCTLQNFPVYLFVSRALASSHSEFFLGGIVREEDFVELLPVPIQCSVKVKIPWSDPTSINTSDYKSVYLGRHYGMVGYDRDSLATRYGGVAFLPLNKEGDQFVVLLAYANVVLVLRSIEMRWKRLVHGSIASCKDIITFRGKFYAVFLNGDVFVIDPYSLNATRLMPPPLELQDCGSSKYLVPSKNDEELFLVEKINPRNTDVVDLYRLACRVSKLDEKGGKWVVVTDLGERVLLIGPPGNASCSAKDLPDGCGVSGNSMLFTNEPWGEVYPYKYGVETEYEEDDLNYWRPSRENRVTILSVSPNPSFMKSPVVALRVER